MHGIESKRRNRSVEETLGIFKEMQVGQAARLLRPSQPTSYTAMFVM